ncbi:MAG: hypothetical protein PHW25_14900 [Zoogloea sp.]|uniref:hypothetical protein n=1 Tax=Zoogloea sp. TaxID=49181 RepID=UPI00260C0CE5|nr:hypothetical protein [Zoogloea sp.]MDD3328369.1 hypothetical protein [Zoogloea sp.]
MNRLLLAGPLLAAPAVAVEAPPSLTYSRTISSAVAIPATAAASPLNLKQLRTLYADVVKPIEPTRLWFKKPLAARLGAERDAEALVQRIEKTFGDAPDSPAAACRSAAIQQRMYVGAMNNMVALAEGHGQPAAIDLLSALGTAVAYGQASADCRRYLERQLPDGKTLEAPAKK